MYTPKSLPLVRVSSPPAGVVALPEGSGQLSRVVIIEKSANIQTLVYSIPEGRN